MNKLSKVLSVESVNLVISVLEQVIMFYSVAEDEAISLFYIKGNVQ